MKKLILYFTITNNIFYVSNCEQNNLLIKDKEIKPPINKTKNINYYQKSINEINKDIKECQELIIEIKLNKNHYEANVDYQSSLDELNSQLFAYQAKKYHYQYQILLLNVNKIFTSNQKQLAKELLINKIKFLKHELELKIKYLDYYGNQKIKTIKNEITTTELILQNFINRGGN